MIRRATPEDMPRIRALHAGTEKKIGCKMDLPEVGDRAILGYWVQERNGVIVKGWYEEMCIEHVEFGEDAEATREMRAFRERVFEAARAKGARYLHCLVPPSLESRLARWAWKVLLFVMSKASRKIGRHLAKSGFAPTGLVHYNRRLR